TSVRRRSSWSRWSAGFGTGTSAVERASPPPAGAAFSSSAAFDAPPFGPVGRVAAAVGFLPLLALEAALVGFEAMSPDRSGAHERLPRPTAAFWPGPVGLWVNAPGPERGGHPPQAFWPGAV